MFLHRYNEPTLLLLHEVRSGPRGAAARVALYLFERDAGVQMLRGG